jgi:Protein of unknown function (DUF2924)
MTPPTDDGTAHQRSGGPSPAPGQPNGQKHSSLIADVDLQIAELVARSTDELQLAWGGVHGTEPPRGLSRDLLIRSLANQLQERTQGAMSRTLRRRIQALVRGFDKGAAPCDLVPRLKTGATLVRQWRGHAHSVLVCDDGFEYDGERYRSLSVIAKRITGAHWSGPRFFCLNKRKAGSAAAQAV